MTEFVSIDSEKVTEIDEETETDVSESERDVEETVGAEVSAVVVCFGRLIRVTIVLEAIYSMGVWYNLMLYLRKLHSCIA